MAARGGLLKLLDAYIAIGGDAADFDKVVDQSEAKAKAAGGRLESAFSPRRVLGALGAVAGAAFGLAMTGANQLDDATKRLVADTGLTGKAAQDAGHSLASMYSNNLQGFDAIGIAMTKVHNDMGLVGKAADDETQRFLTFQKATGQASDAVTEFDKIQDAWNLTAADTQGLMDKLIVSHQKFGGSVADSETALAAMAPAMQAANMSIDDGIALLNLFETAGIDAAKAPAALARAVKELKPGQDLNDLIAQIGAIEDPTMRGQEAMRIFGARSGIGLAQAIKPGMTSLADLTASLGDTAGASDKAAEAALSWGDRATLAMHKVGGALAEFGTQFGPLLMVAATIGPKFTTALLSGLGGLAGFFGPKLLGLILPEGIAAGTTAGAATGTAFGIAIGPAIALAIPAAILIGLTAAKPTIQKWLDDMGLHVPNLFEGQGALAPPGQIVPVGPQTTYAEGSAAAHEAAMMAAGASDAAAIAAGLASGAPKMLAASKDLGYNVLNGFLGPLQLSPDKVVAAFGTSLAGVVSASKQTGTDGMIAMAAGVTAARAKPLDAFGTLVEMLKHQLSPMAEEARLKGELTSKQLAAGLKSGDPAVRAQALAVRNAIYARLGELAAAGGPAGRDAMAQLDAGIRSKVPEVSTAALAAKNVALAQLQALAVPAGAAGQAAGSAFAAGILRVISSTGVSRFISTGGTAAGGKIYEGKASGGPVTAGYPYIVNENTPRSEWFVPETSGRILTADQAAGQGMGRGGGGDTFSPTVNVSVSAGSDVSPGAARRFGQAVADEVANVLQEQNARFASRLRVARA